MMESGVDQVRACILSAIKLLHTQYGLVDMELHVHPSLLSTVRECLPEHKVVVGPDIVCSCTDGGEYISDIWVVGQEVE